jgi:hypothetical protein
MLLYFFCLFFSHWNSLAKRHGRRRRRSARGEFVLRRKLQYLPHVEQNWLRSWFVSPAWKRKKLKIEFLLAIWTKMTGEGQMTMSQMGSPTGGPTWWEQERTEYSNLLETIEFCRDYQFKGAQMIQAIYVTELSNFSIIPPSFCFCFTFVLPSFRLHTPFVYLFVYPSFTLCLPFVYPLLFRRGSVVFFVVSWSWSSRTLLSDIPVFFFRCRTNLVLLLGVLLLAGNRLVVV